MIKQLLDLEARLSPDVIASETPLFTITRVTALWPVSITPVKHHKYFVMKWSPWATFYSLVVFVFFETWGANGVFREIMAGGNSLRMQTDTARVVISIDILAIIAMAGVAILNSPFRLIGMARFYNIIFQVDKILIQEHPKEDRTNNLKLLTIIFGALSIALTSDITYWLLNLETFMYFREYMAFYMLYFIVTSVEMAFANSAVMVMRRLKWINEHLDLYTTRYLLSRPKINVLELKANPQGPVVVDAHAEKKFGSILDVFMQQNKMFEATDVARGRSKLTVLSQSPVEYISKLMQAHSMLCDAVLASSDGFGFMITIILIGVLSHLVETPYFLIQGALSGQRSVYFLLMQFIWFFLHIGRLLLLIEPCHRASQEAINMTRNVCGMLIYPILDDRLRDQLNFFSMQLLHRQISYSACGLCTLGRPLFTAIAGAITTYLVILLQFSKDVKKES